MERIKILCGSVTINSMYKQGNCINPYNNTFNTYVENIETNSTSGAGSLLYSSAYFLLFVVIVADCLFWFEYLYMCDPFLSQDFEVMLDNLSTFAYTMRILLGRELLDSTFKPEERLNL